MPLPHPQPRSWCLCQALPQKRSFELFTAPTNLAVGQELCILLSFPLYVQQDAVAVQLELNFAHCAQAQLYNRQTIC